MTEQNHNNALADAHRNLSGIFSLIDEFAGDPDKITHLADMGRPLMAPVAVQFRECGEAYPGHFAAVFDLIKEFADTPDRVAYLADIGRDLLLPIGDYLRETQEAPGA